MSENNNTIYLLYKDKFREAPPMSVATRKLGLRTAIETLIHDQSVRFLDEEGRHIPDEAEEIRAFRAFWKDSTLSEANERLLGAFIDITINGGLI